MQIVSHKVAGHKLILKVKTFSAGRISVKGKDLRTIFKRVSRATTVTIEVPLSRKGLAALAHHRRLKIRVRVGFVPKQKGESVSAASVAVKL